MTLAQGVVILVYGVLVPMTALLITRIIKVPRRNRLSDYKDRERLLAEKHAWEEIWNIEESMGLEPRREPLPTRPNPSLQPPRSRGTGSGGPMFTADPGPRMAPPIPLRTVMKFGTENPGPR